MTKKGKEGFSLRSRRVRQASGFAGTTAGGKKKVARSEAPGNGGGKERGGKGARIPRASIKPAFRSRGGGGKRTQTQKERGEHAPLPSVEKRGDGGFLKNRGATARTEKDDQGEKERPSSACTGGLAKKKRGRPLEPARGSDSSVVC